MKSGITCPIVEPGVFVQPAGAQLRSSPDEAALVKVWEEVGECFGYLKPDGWRIQIHKRGEAVNLFSRTGKDWTADYSLIAQAIHDQVEADQIILDTELVGFDRNGHHLDPSHLRNAVQFRCYLLDLLYLNGRDFTSKPTQERIPFLWEHLHDARKAAFVFADYTRIHSLEDLIGLYQVYQRRKKEGFDGVIIKRLDTPYFTDVLKVKPEETIDAVVVGAYFQKEGELKTLLLAVPSHKSNTWVPIAKVKGKGAEWDAVYSACKPYKLGQRPYNMGDPPDRPQIWFAPKTVVAVSLTELRSVKNYQVLADAARKCVLREDKGPEEATSLEQVLLMANLSESPNPRQLSLFDNSD